MSKHRVRHHRDSNGAYTRLGPDRDRARTREYEESIGAKPSFRRPRKATDRREINLPFFKLMKNIKDSK
jgi:hypothetical protein